MFMILVHVLLVKDEKMHVHLYMLSENINPVCVLCNMYAESDEHLFSSCSYTQAILDSCPFSLSTSWANLLDGNVIIDNLDSLRRRFVYLYIAAAFHAVWKERNNRIHNPGKSVSTTAIIGDIKACIKARVHSNAEFKRKARFYWEFKMNNTTKNNTEFQSSNTTAEQQKTIST